MFDHVVLRRAESGAPITAGQIAEALLFYQKVHLVIDRGTLLGLLGQIGAPSLVALISRPDFSAVYTEEILATTTNSVGVSKCHDFGAFVLSGDQKVGQLNTVNERLPYEFERAGIGICPSCGSGPYWRRHEPPIDRNPHRSVGRSCIDRRKSLCDLR